MAVDKEGGEILCYSRPARGSGSSERHRHSTADFGTQRNRDGRKKTPPRLPFGTDRLEQSRALRGDPIDEKSIKGA